MTATAQKTALEIMDEQGPIAAPINYAVLPNSQTASCENCHWSTNSKNGGGTMDCHFSGVRGAHPSEAQRPKDWWCNNFIPKQKVLREVNKE